MSALGATRRAIAIALFFSASRAVAGVAVDPCTGLDPGQLERALHLEIGAHAADALLVRLECPSNDEVTLRIESAPNEPPLERRLARPREPEILARLVSLAAHELLAEPPRVLAARASTPIRLQGFLGVEGPYGPTSALAQLGVGLAGQLADPIDWSLAVAAGYGQRGLAAGTVTTGLVVADGVLVFRRHWRTTTASLGVGLRVGGAQIEGHPREASFRGDSLRGAIAGPLASFGWGFETSRCCSLAASAQAGWLLVPLRANVDGAPAVTFDGPWVGLRIGLETFW